MLATIFDKFAKENLTTFVSEQQLRAAQYTNTGKAKTEIDAALEAVEAEKEKRPPDL